jgi:hypothetical protein
VAEQETQSRREKMIIIVKSRYPMDQARKMAEIYVKEVVKNPEPDYMTLHGPYATTDEDQGVTVVSFYELDNAKLADGLQWAGEAMAPYMVVPGLKYTVRPWSDAGEALKIIGMTDPKA